MARFEITKDRWRLVAQFIENALAYALPVFVQQFLVNPLMANKLGAEANGTFLAAIALNYFVINITAAVICNVRLLKNRQYEEQKIKGDFNILLLIFGIVDALIIAGGTIFYANGQISPLDIALSVVLVLLFIYHDYISAQYRLELRFRNILVNNLILCAGYLIGLIILYYALPCWQIVFIVPYLMTAVYDYFHTDFIREPFQKTPLFEDTVRQYFLLLVSTLIGAVVTYGDRLILKPLLGGTSVSILSSAQLIGKMLQMISTPVSSFVLSHLVKRKITSLKFNIRHILLSAMAGMMLLGGCLLISKPLITFLYPAWAAQSLDYVPLTATNGTLHMMNMIVNVFVLRLCHPKWQIMKAVVYLVSYMLFSFVLLSLFGLTGFCIGNIIASAIELGFLMMVLFAHSKAQGNPAEDAK